MSDSFLVIIKGAQSAWGKGPVMGEEIFKYVI